MGDANGWRASDSKLALVEIGIFVGWFIFLGGRRWVGKGWRCGVYKGGRSIFCMSGSRGVGVGL